MTIQNKNEKIYHSYDELEKDWFPRAREERLKKEKEREELEKYKEKKTFLESIKRIQF
ncbi:hypothetical protein MsAg5_17870 [Methanosarcinaceae archaeon Ag5]|uniref:Uncharacterized protein n=1 Tax=Methanolapillus africanus TaxID=3028297 RepID=A0AAE4MJR5_9EURY|nr:hypothetical protein [Methanosarcinaceae archaeon Ag5]